MLIKIVLIIKLETSTNFRAISQILKKLSENGVFELGAPSHATIASWVKKIGVYQLGKIIEPADDWVLIMDESIEFGGRKLLVILGIRERDIDFSRALKYEDMQTLVVEISQSWKGAEISPILNRLKQRIGPIKYIVADMGNALRKAMRLSEIKHVEDITHKLSWFIKKLYEKDCRFIKFTKILAKLRGSLPLSQMAYILPPAQRVSSRFMNLKPIVDYGVAVCEMLRQNNCPAAEEKILKPIAVYSDFIAELKHIVYASVAIQKIVKNNGLSSATMHEIKEVLSKIEPSIKIKTFINQVIDYLEKTLNDLGVAPNRIVLCTSDILESAFGKYKNYIHGNPSVGITDLCLAIPAFTFNYKDNESLLNALEAVKTYDREQWSASNIGQSMYSKRKITLQKQGGTKNSQT